MADDDATRIDPRYDPVFQRGYAGEVRMGSRSESALRRAAVARPAAVRSATPSTVAPPSPASSPTERSAEVAVDAPTAEQSASVGDPERDAEASPAEAPPVAERKDAAPASAREVTRNPFYLGAAALAVLLVIGGAVWLEEGFAAIAEGAAASTTGYYASMTMSFGAPMLIGIGIAIIAGLLFALARGWRSRGR